MEQQITIDIDTPATMRDGTVLRATIYRPAGEGRWPVLLMRTIYGKDLPHLDVLIDLDPARVARQGYVVIIQDVRGRFASDGTWDLPNLALEGPDGEDTVQWAASLPFSNGQIGMYGISYFAFTQLAALSQHPPALHVAVPAKTWHDVADGIFFRGGALELGLITCWRLPVWFDICTRLYRHHQDRQLFAAQMQRLIAAIDGLPQGVYALPLKEYTPFTTDERGGPSWISSGADGIVNFYSHFPRLLVWRSLRFRHSISPAGMMRPYKGRSTIFVLCAITAAQRQPGR